MSERNPLPYCLAHLAQINPVAAWQPIETAPKDGTVVDVLVNGKRVPDAYWSFSKNADGVPQETAFDCWAKVGQFAGMGGVYPVGVGGEPTHWLKRPEPPS